MPHNLIVSDKAEKNLNQIYDYIAKRAGAFTAKKFTDAIKVSVDKLTLFPHIGTKRDELKHGYRTVGYKKRVTIVFSIHEKDVVIHAILYGGRDLGKALL